MSVWPSRQVTPNPLAGLDPATAPALQALRESHVDLGGARLYDRREVTPTARCTA